MIDWVGKVRQTRRDDPPPPYYVPPEPRVPQNRQTYPRGARVVDARDDGEELAVVEPRPVKEGEGAPAGQAQGHDGVARGEAAAEGGDRLRGLELEGEGHFGGDGQGGEADGQVVVELGVGPLGDVCVCMCVW